MAKNFMRHQAQQEIYVYNIIVIGASESINEDSEEANVKLVECSQTDDLNNFVYLFGLVIF